MAGFGEPQQENLLFALCCKKAGINDLKNPLWLFSHKGFVYILFHLERDEYLISNTRIVSCDDNCSMSITVQNSHNFPWSTI